MSASTILSKYNVTIPYAREWIMQNVSTPRNIFDVAKEFGLSNTDLAEIVGGGFSAHDVRDFFSSNGIESYPLDSAPISFPQPSRSVPRNTSIIDRDAAQQPQIRDLLKFNTNETGALSSEALAREVISRVGMDRYVDTFGPQRYLGAQDGIFSSADLGGISSLNGSTTTPATIENIQELFFGTVLEGFSKFDKAEFTALKQFTRDNYKAMFVENNDHVANMFEEMVSNALMTPATEEHLSLADKQAYATAAGVYYVEIVGGSLPSDSMSLVDGVPFSLLPW